MPKATPWDGIDDARRAVMRAIKSKDTKPELALRSLLHRAGYRYRLHRTDLPGKPDLVFASKRKVIFVHGCFWHSHCDGVCKAASVPKARADYWGAKLARNKARDERNAVALAQRGWQSLVVWECWLRDSEKALAIAQAFLGEPRRADRQ